MMCAVEYFDETGRTPGSPVAALDRLLRERTQAATTKIVSQTSPNRPPKT
jgi:hypothetical protein